ncbi:1888_t:CDS:1, partial [Gigaspora rosea]
RDHTVLLKEFTLSISGFVYLRFLDIGNVEFLRWGRFCGSLFVWNRKLRISFGYGMNSIWILRMSELEDEKRCS